MFCEENETLWHAMRLFFNDAWFVITVQHVDSSVEDGAGITTQTILVGGVRDLVLANAGNSDSMTTFRVVYVVLPSYLNKSGGWEMRRLRTVWVADAQHQFGPPEYIYEDIDGRIFCDPEIEPLVQDIRKSAPLLSF